MSESGGQEPLLNLDDVERALVLAREVASATQRGGAANIRLSHLRELFAKGGSPPSAARMQLALTAAGLRVDPPLDQNPESVSLRVLGDRAALAAEAPQRRRRPKPRQGQQPAGPDHDFDAVEHDDPPAPLWGAGAYRAAAGLPDPERAFSTDFDLEPEPEPEPEPPPRRERKTAAEIAAAEEPALTATDPDAPLTLADMERMLASKKAGERSAASIAALMPALIVPVLAASFLGPVFGAIFAGAALLTSATLSRPGALAGGRLGPLRMPASLARSFLLASFLVALVALAVSIALAAAGGADTSRTPESQPLHTDKQRTTPKTTTPPAPPQNQRTTP